MRIVSISEITVKQLFSSVVVNDEVCKAIVKVVNSFGGSVLHFVKTTIYLYSKLYVRATDPDSGISGGDLVKILTCLKSLDPNIGVDEILSADRMDLLYGNDYRSYSEFTKFDNFFYEDVFNIVTGCSYNDMTYADECLFEETIRALEYIITTIEQYVVFSNSDADIDDLVIVCVLHKQNMLYFILM